ncbi:MAG TPA: hypothetical protein VGM85_14815 [Paraburkholderia sp.]
MSRPDQSQQPDDDQGGKTFNTDVSETDDEGTSVREAEVREDDLSEVKPSSPERSSEDSGSSS